MTSSTTSTSGSESPVLDLRNLTKKYGSFTALDDLSLSLNAGQILGLIGPNGAGKTTTIKILVGLIRPTAGHASIAGVDCVKNSKQVKRLVGYMPDKFGQYDNVRVWEYLDFFGAAFGIPVKERTKRIEEVMELTGTAYMRDRYVDSLSHGMQQRVGLARTLVHDPKVLILDEPVNGLDPQARIEMRDLLIMLAGQGKTLLVTSHILPELARICHKCAIVTNGKLRAFGTVEEIGRQVSQKRTMEVQLERADQVEGAGALIRASLGDNVEVTESETEATVRFRSAIPETILGKLLRRLLAKDFLVTQYREVQTDLEEAFMSFARPKETLDDEKPATSGVKANA